jgi:hypothetical protein
MQQDPSTPKQLAHQYSTLSNAMQCPQVAQGMQLQHPWKQGNTVQYVSILPMYGTVWQLM